MAAVGNLTANGTLHSDKPKKIKNVAKKSTSKPAKMMNGENVKMPVSEGKEKLTAAVMNGQMKHLGTEDRKRVAESDLKKDSDLQVSSKVTKLDAMDISDSAAEKDSKAGSSVDADPTDDVEGKKAQNGEASGGDSQKESEKPSDADAPGDPENSISGSDDKTDADAAAADDESKELHLLSGESGDEGSAHDEDEALLLSDDEKKDAATDKAKNNNNEKESSDDKGSVGEKEAEKTVSGAQNGCDATEETETDNKDKSPSDNKEISDSGPASDGDTSVGDGKSPARTDANDTNGEVSKDMPGDGESAVVPDSTKSSGKDGDGDKNDLKEKNTDPESASTTENKDSDLRDKEGGLDVPISKSSEDADVDKQDIDGAEGLQLDVSADSDCIISADKATDAVANGNSKSGVIKSSGDTCELNASSDSITVDLDLEILSDDEDKDKNGAAAKRAASPGLTDDIQPLAKKGRLTSSDSSTDVTAESEVDLSDVTCEEGTVTLPVKVLEAFIHRRVRSYLENTTKAKLLKRVEELQNAVDKWRQVAKTLEKKVKDVAAVRGGLRSNSKVASRNMAVQCDVVKLQALAQQKVVTQASPAKVTLPVSVPPMVSTTAGLRPLAPNNIAFIQTPTGTIMTGNNTLQVVNPNATKTVRDLLEQQRQSHLVQVVGNTSTSQVRLPVSQSQSQTVKGFIDLTEEAGEDKSLKTLQPGTVIITSPGASVPASSVVLQSVNQPIRPQNTVLVSNIPSSQLRGGQVLVQRSPTVTIAPTNAVRPVTPIQPKHPAPLPAAPVQKSPTNVKKLPPPKPSLKISRVQQGIVLSWNMNLTNEYSDISNYQLFAYQEQTGPVLSSLWKKVGDVRALPLPMACTLTQFQEGNKYHFAVRAVDIHGRIGPFSLANSIHLVANPDS